MDTKRLITIVLLSLAIMVGWQYLNTQLHRWHPEWYERPVTTRPAPATQDSATRPVTRQATIESTTQQTTPPAAGKLNVVGGEARTVSLGHGQYDPKAQANYPMGLVLTSRGAAVQSVMLNRYAQTYKKEKAYVYQLPYEVGPVDQRYSMAARRIQIINAAAKLDESADLAGKDWRLVASAADSATFAVDVFVGGNPQPLTVTKQYQLRPKADKTEGYQVAVNYAFENKTGAPLNVKLVFNGPNEPTNFENRTDIAQMLAGFNDDEIVKLKHDVATSYSPDKAPAVIEEKKLSLLWAGVTSTYFMGIVQPKIEGGKAPQLAQASVQTLAPAAETGEHYLAFTFETAELSVPAGKTESLPLDVYFGPRKREVLNNGYYVAYPRSYDKTLLLTGGMCGFCTFDWLVRGLVYLLTGLHFLLRDWGLAIIALVVIVRLLLHPITKRSQISMSKMSKMGPEIERLKKKYGDNKEELNRAMMQVYREQGFTPILGCLPMLLQMPIWIALWQSLQSTFELRHAPFLWGWTWIKDLAQPDRLVSFGGSYGIWFLKAEALNLLPILMGVVFYFQNKYMQPKPVSETPEQQQQRKMMQWMTLLFPVLLYTGPSGLNLYILTSTAIGIWESKRVRDHLKEQEEREKAGRVIIDAPATRARRGGKLDEPQSPPRGCLGGIMAKLESAQKEAEKRYGKGKK